MTKEEFDEYYKGVIDCVKSIIGDDIKIDYGNHFVNGKFTNDIYRCTIEKDYCRSIAVNMFKDEFPDYADKLSSSVTTMIPY